MKKDKGRCGWIWWGKDLAVFEEIIRGLDNVGHGGIIARISFYIHRRREIQPLNLIYRLLASCFLLFPPFSANLPVTSRRTQEDKTLRSLNVKSRKEEREKSRIKKKNVY